MRKRLSGFIRRPSNQEICTIAASEYMTLTEEETKDLSILINNTLEEIDKLDEIESRINEIKYFDRDPGYRPTFEEDPYNVFIRKCKVKGESHGLLSGKTIGLKDNIRLAGVPMTNGSRLAPGYVPVLDATVVERLLEAGGTIIGKLNMDSFGMGGTSETSDFGVPLNPHNREFSTGGSSGGSAAAVAASEVNISLGVDEGGSARIPASWCGVISIKPTHGLVPSFGITYLDHTIDYICPTASTVEDTAITLEVIAGEDKKDPQWIRGQVNKVEYSKAKEENINGLKIGLIKESTEWSESENDVNKSIINTLKVFEKKGASVKTISLPWWGDTLPILHGILSHSASNMVESDLEGYSRGGACDPYWQGAFGKARRAGSNGFPTLLKVWMILGKYLRREYCSIYFSKAQNARLVITSMLDEIFKDIDVLVSPTTPMKASRITSNLKEGSWDGKGKIEMNRNTCPTNLTGHPAMSIPCGFGKNGLPIGIQVMGKKWDEYTLFRLAYEMAGEKKFVI